MNSLILTPRSHSTAYLGALSADTRRRRVPAVYAPCARGVSGWSTHFLPKCGDCRYVAVYVAELPDR